MAAETLKAKRTTFLITSRFFVRSLLLRISFYNHLVKQGILARSLLPLALSLTNKTAVLMALPFFLFLKLNTSSLSNFLYKIERAWPASRSLLRTTILSLIYKSSILCISHHLQRVCFCSSIS